MIGDWTIKVNFSIHLKKHVPPSNNFKSCNKHVMRREKSIRCSLSSCCDTKFSEWTYKKEYGSLEGEYPIRSVKELKKLCIDNLYCLLLYCWFVCFFGCFCFLFFQEPKFNPFVMLHMQRSWYPVVKMVLLGFGIWMLNEKRYEWISLYVQLSVCVFHVHLLSTHSISWQQAVHLINKLQVVC